MRNGCNTRHHRRGWKKDGPDFAALFGPEGPFGEEGPFGRGGPFGGRGGRGGGRFGGGRGRRRMFDRGELRLVLLKLLADEPRHGYDLIKAIEDLTGGEYAPSPGVIYPTMQMMLDEGMIAEIPNESSRKVFSVTEAGQAELAEQQELAAKLIDRLAKLGEERRSSPHRQIQRAMENLHNALRNRRDDGLDAETVERIVDVIDEAARKVERL
ncbi:DNA-binding PadR family transcriptional regulator [Altererythrobacter atlanticus]|uniref:Transcriptional regulator YqjI n=1 Tax=Croceibacterium atlanticum TaxID=1267766 RepID=A0A0F7KT66_9SPHN|nr:PadR family transcriptional regulator [Croceibacterium atlanticum]AKH42356.1 Transcriptional regulator YqjI [Croceibacterium atlanticum]MBB5731133.1 DNA-binding PadR family transcriptional regulator [Croceibacterium atlanticum]